MPDLAWRIARVLVYKAEDWAHYRRKTHFCVLSKKGREPPPFPYQWQRKNMFGCSWERADRAAAIAWAYTALQHDFIVFYGIPKSGGNGSGMGVEHGLNPYTEEDAINYLAYNEPGKKKKKSDAPTKDVGLP